MSLDLNQQNEPWWAKHRDKTFLMAFGVMFLMLIGLLPSPLSRGVEGLDRQHKEMGKTLQVMCVHDSKTTAEALECVRGEVKTLEKDTKP